MGMFSSLFVGVSGMRVNERAIAVIGDNIANMNTVGFKGSRGVFADMLNRTMLGTTADTSVGQGAQVQAVQRLHGQGALLGTGVATDVAIGGEGFFMLQGQAGGSSGTFYSRSGQFQIDDQGRLVNQAGLRLQGYQADTNGDLGSKITDLKIEPLTSPPRATTEVILDLNLQSGITAAESVGFGGLGNPEAAGEEPPTGDFSTTVVVYDSQGNAHDLDVYFAYDGDGQWSWRALTLSEDVDAGSGEFYTVLAEGELSFQDGLLDSESGQLTFPVDYFGEDVSEQSITIDFGESLQDGGDGSGTQSTAAKSSVNAVDVDGRQPGDFQFLQILNDGRVLGTFSNGAEQPLGQIALATFTSPTGLDGIGGNLFRETHASGQPVVGNPSSGNRGELFSGALEGSNVDLSFEFTQMIIAQRGYQASSRTITTVDAMLNEVVNLKR